MKIKIDISTSYVEWKKEQDINKKHILLVLNLLDCHACARKDELFIVITSHFVAW